MCQLLQFFNLFAQFKTTTKSHENYLIHFPIWPYTPLKVMKKTVFSTSKLYGLTGMWIAYGNSQLVCCVHVYFPCVLTVWAQWALLCFWCVQGRIRHRDLSLKRKKKNLSTHQGRGHWRLMFPRQRGFSASRCTCPCRPVWPWQRQVSQCHRSTAIQEHHNVSIEPQRTWWLHNVLFFWSNSV